MDFMTKFRINLIAKFPYPYTTELFCSSNYIHLCSHKTLSSSSNQCCQLVYIYIPNFKILVYFQSAWCIWKIWYIFVGGLIWDFTPNYLFYCKAWI